MDNQETRDLNDSLDLMVRLTRMVLTDATRAANGSSCHTTEWTLRSAEHASWAALNAHRAHYDQDVRDIMDREEEALEEAELLLEEQKAYVNRVHAEMFPGR